MTRQLPTLTTDALTGDAVFADSVMITRLRGTADVDARPALDHFVDAIHLQTQELGGSKVVIDFRELEFMNSSSFKVFVTWLANIQDLTEDRQYRVHFVSNPSIHWQKRSLMALSCFATNLVTIET